MMKSKTMALLLVASLLALTGVSGCATLARKAIEGATGVSVDEDGTKVTVKGDDGTTTTLDMEGADLPKGYPKDVPVYEGTIDSSWESSDGSQVTYVIAVKTKDPLDKVTAWYEKELKQGGWEIKSTFKDKESAAFLAEKGELTFHLAAGVEDDGTMFTQTVAPKTQ